MELIPTLAEAADEDALDLFFGFIKSSLLVSLLISALIMPQNPTISTVHCSYLLSFLHRTTSSRVTAELSSH
jgi:hypothetical protein